MLAPHNFPTVQREIGVDCFMAMTVCFLKKYAIPLHVSRDYSFSEACFLHRQSGIFMYKILLFQIFV